MSATAHDWKPYYTGVWETNYRCKKCGSTFQENHDDPNSEFPKTLCVSSDHAPSSKELTMSNFANHWNKSLYQTLPSGEGCKPYDDREHIAKLEQRVKMLEDRLSKLYVTPYDVTMNELYWVKS